MINFPMNEEDYYNLYIEYQTTDLLVLLAHYRQEWKENVNKLSSLERAQSIANVLADRGVRW